MKRMLVKVSDSSGRLGPEYIVVKTGFQLFMEKITKVVLIVFSFIGLCSTVYFLFGS